MTRRRNIRDVQVNRRYGALCARERLRIRRLLQLVMNFAQLAESDALGEEAQRRERRRAALIAAPRGVDRGYRVQHLARSDSSRSICATTATALLQHYQD